MTEKSPITQAVSRQRDFGDTLHGILDTIPHNRREALIGTTSEQYLNGEKVPSPFAVNLMSKRLGLLEGDPRIIMLNIAAVDTRVRRGPTLPPRQRKP